MTTTQPASGTEKELRAYVEGLQNRACRLAGVLTALAFIENEGKCEEGRAALTYLAEELALELDSALDTVNLPKGAN